jgi:hypothetical protein
LHNAKGVNPEKLIAKFPCDKNSISESLRELRDYDSGAMIVEITFRGSCRLSLAPTMA